MRYIIQIVGRKYDPYGEYVKKWVPELKDVPIHYIHKPWKMREEQQMAYNARLGIDYPHPIRDPNVGDERRRYRYLRRRGMEIPTDLEDNVKTRIRKDKNSNYGDDGYDSREESEHDEDDDGDDVDYENNEGVEEGNDNTSDEINNEIIRKMHNRNTTNAGRYRDLHDDKPRPDSTSDSTTTDSTPPELKPPKQPSPTKNKWRINL